MILDDLGRANFRFVRVKPDVTKSASLAQEVPSTDPVRPGFAQAAYDRL
jgi:hypothetical protein